VAQNVAVEASGEVAPQATPVAAVATPVPDPQPAVPDAPAPAEAATDVPAPVAVDVPAPATAVTPASQLAELRQELADREQALTEAQSSAQNLADHVATLKAALAQATQSLYDQSVICQEIVSATLTELQAEICRFSPQPPAAADPKKIAVTLTRRTPIGERIWEPGELLGYVTTAEGVTLDYLVRALQSDIAHGLAR
jgi:hypothetical protein